MNLQYISDSKGKTTGVYIPISEWNAFKLKYQDIDLEDFDIPAWQINEIQKRRNNHKKTPNEVLDFESTMNEIDKAL